MSGGRPPKYMAEYAEQAFRLCLLGATDDDLADAFHVEDRTIDRWKKAHPEFCRSVHAGKDEADANVAQSLYQRALGYSHPAVKIVADAKSGEHVSVPYTEHYPPDTMACSFWLKNRQRGKWRDKQDHEVTGAEGGAIEVRTIRLPAVVEDPNEWAERFRGAAHANGTNGKNGTNGDGH